jgi:hypothetical protein
MLGGQVIPFLVHLSQIQVSSFNLISFQILVGCSAAMNTNTKNIVINALPNVPLTSNQEFCKVQNATIANLVPNGSQYRWYNSITYYCTACLNGITIRKLLCKRGKCNYRV